MNAIITYSKPMSVGHNPMGTENFKIQFPNPEYDPSIHATMRWGAPSKYINYVIYKTITEYTPEGTPYYNGMNPKWGSIGKLIEQYKSSNISLSKFKELIYED